MWHAAGFEAAVVVCTVQDTQYFRAGSRADGHVPERSSELYSGISHLRRFSFQRLKIDRSFVSGLGSTHADEELVQAVIALAQKLEIETVAEGVETEAQLVFLREEGCDFVQGYLFGRPAPTQEFESVLEQEKDEG